MINQLVNYDEVLTPKEVQKMLKIGRATTYNYLRDGTIKSIKIGNKYRIPKRYLLDYLYGDKQKGVNNG